MRVAGGVFTMGFRVLGRGSEDMHAEIRKKKDISFIHGSEKRFYPLNVRGVLTPDRCFTPKILLNSD